MTAHDKLAAKYGLKFGGNFSLEGISTISEDLENKCGFTIDGTQNLVNLVGYIENTEVEYQKTGFAGRRVTTSLVRGLAVRDGSIYAITDDYVYRLYGPWLGEVITSNPFLNGLWKGIADQIKKHTEGS
ncbi:hypothetical protein W70_55 [Escherichia phage W70]|nr:hypothetical protein W70_55 [Escherichia phage W70]